MITSQTAPFSAEISAELDIIPADKLTYLQERFRNRLYDLVVSEFIKHNSANPEFTQAALARRINSRPEVVNRWLSSPGNWRLDTVSNLLVGICGAELEMSLSRFCDQPARNYHKPEWLDEREPQKALFYNVPPPPVGSFMPDPLPYPMAKT